MTRTDQDLLLAELIAAETAVWRALSRGDAAADRALLAHDFLGVYPSGFAGREDHVGQLEAGPSIARFRIEEPHLLAPAPGLALLSYRAVYCRASPAAANADPGADPGALGPGAADGAADQALEEVMLVSSLWRHENGGWINLFSQDTPVA